MKVILIKDVENLGKMGDIVDVAKGHARNYLLPRSLAIAETKENLERLKERKQKYAQLLLREKTDCEELAKKINSMSLTIAAQAGDEDKLFGSVTADDIAEALKNENIDVDKKKIHLNEPIKKLGVYQVEVKLHPEVTAMPKLWVVKR